MRRVAAASLLLAVAIGCSGPPAKERQQADAALAAARAAGAARYDPDDLHAAESALRNYDAAVAQHDFRQALDVALNARDLAYEALQQTNARRKALKTQYDRLVLDVKHLVDRENERVAAGATPRLSSRAAQHVRDTVHTATQAMQKAGTLAADDQYQDAVDLLKDASTTLHKDVGEVPAAQARRGRQSRTAH